jgi:hypothetical protein
MERTSSRNRTTWIVDLAVQGPITVSRSVRLSEPKGLRRSRPYYSNIKLKSTSYGVQASVTTLASTRETAYRSATFFIGQMLDVLVTRIHQPLFLHYAETTPPRTDAHNVRRVVEQSEWRDAFYEARLLALAEPDFLRALSWFRKGMTTEDPIDSFLAFWNAIEIVAGKYHKPDKRTKQGIKNQIWECFIRLWGQCESWPIIPGNTEWIDENYHTRIQIAHGVAAVDIEQVERVMFKLETIQKVAHIFLIDWREAYIDPTMSPELAEKFGYE